MAGITERVRGRRRWIALAAAVAVAAVVVGVVAGMGGKGAHTGTGTTPGSLLPSPPAQTPPLLNESKVKNAVGQLDGIVRTAMKRTGVPGVATAVVYKDKVIYSKGFGVREVGKPAKINPDTVFLVASVSKPLASTIVAGVVGQKLITFDDPVIKHSPRFALNDPYVTKNATFVDLLSHRSGLYTGAGDLLEDLGYEQDYILAHLDQQPLDAFRSTYNYSNFGYTWGGVAAADAAGMSWEDLADKTLFRPLGMTDSSYRHADYLKRSNKALIHAEVDPKAKTWAAKYDRDADAEAPAGGASSSVKDMAKFLRLQLGHGTFEGEKVIDPDALDVTHFPHKDRGPPPAPYGRVGFYGLGWNVGYDEFGRLRLDHSGAFELGTGTNVLMLPGEDLGIVTLTNGSPIGVPEAINNAFFDAAQNGAPTVAWLSLFEGAFRAEKAAYAPAVDYSKRPAQPKPPKANSAYTGTYANSYYGPLTVSDDNGKLSMTLGPASKPTVFPLTHFDGDTFSFQTIGENANGLAGAIFKTGAGGTITSVTLDFYDTRGLGTFVRN
jgi:CubicO group peptidase (beta-lactamase class C family)